jgi:hypothetical protein
MRKFLFMMLLTVVGSVAISSCTEDEVNASPSRCEQDCTASGCGCAPGGGATSDPKL